MEPGKRRIRRPTCATRDPGWGLRVLEDVASLATGSGFGPPSIEPMPANNLLVVFRRLA